MALDLSVGRLMLNRRHLLKSVAAGSLGLAAGCGARTPIAGGFIGPSVDIGHRLRDGVRIDPANADWEEFDAVIVGGGVAGLAAARRLVQEGLERVIVLELESQPGGTSAGGESDVTRYPWGAHYLPVPLPGNKPLIALLDEMGVLERIDDNGRPVVAEQFLCREPEERLFSGGRWLEGLLPDQLLTSDDRTALAAFQSEVDRWVTWRDAHGRRAFAIPLAASSDDVACTDLDRISLQEWLDQHSLRSERLRWMLDYACRDDYGCTLGQTSAWAGLFYFAARQEAPGEHSQPLITWPEGNARLVKHMADGLGERVRTGVVVAAVQTQDDPQAPVQVHGFNTSDDRPVAIRAPRVILAVPQFLVPHLVQGFPEQRAQAARQFTYAPWLVANLHLRDRPRAAGIPLAWDSVFLDSDSLGYITATHQAGNDHGPTVLTYYYPFCDDDPRGARQRLLDMTWSDVCDLVLADMRTPHPDIRELVERIDVMRWGHGMIRPHVGFIWSAQRRESAAPWRGVHFAHTDLSGVALFEEAFYHGNRAAEEVLTARGDTTVRLGATGSASAS